MAHRHSPSRASGRMAILLSGHVRDACSKGMWAIEQQALHCRAMFVHCDVFIHSWETSNVDDGSTGSSHAASSWDCVRQIATAVSAAAVTVQRQAVDALNMSQLWGSSSISYEGALA